MCVCFFFVNRVTSYTLRYMVSYHTCVLKCACVTVFFFYCKQASDVTAEDAKRSGFARNGIGRNSLGRKLRGMKRIMGKKSTPPTSPTGSTGTASSAGKSPRGGGVGPYAAALGQGHSGSEHGGEEEEPEGGAHGSENGSAGVVEIHAKGKAFLEAMDESGSGVGVGVGVGGESVTGDASPDPTASTGTGTSGYTSPSSQKSGAGGMGGVSADSAGSGERNEAATSSFNAA